MRTTLTDDEIDNFDGVFGEDCVCSTVTVVDRCTVVEQLGHVPRSVADPGCRRLGRHRAEGNRHPQQLAPLCRRGYFTINV